MKVQKSHLRIALFVLVAAVLFNLFLYFRPAAVPAASRAPQVPLIAGPTTPGAAVGAQIDPLSIRAPRDVDMARVPVFGRDPFLFGDETREIVRAVASVRDSGPDPQVRSILFSSTRRLAIVDGKIVGVGDMVGMYRVVEIEHAAVVFALPDGGRRRVPVHGAMAAGLTR